MRKDVRKTIRLTQEQSSAYERLLASRGKCFSNEIQCYIQSQIDTDDRRAEIVKVGPSRRFNVTLKPDEYEAVANEAALHGMIPTQWAAMAIRRWLRLDTRPALPDYDSLRIIARQLNGATHNINQIAKACNQLAMQSRANAEALSGKLDQLPQYMNQIRAFIVLIKTNRRLEEWYWYKHHLEEARGVAPVQPLDEIDHNV